MDQLKKRYENVMDTTREKAQAMQADAAEKTLKADEKLEKVQERTKAYAEDKKRARATVKINTALVSAVAAKRADREAFAATQKLSVSSIKAKEKSEKTTALAIRAVDSANAAEEAAEAASTMAHTHSDEVIQSVAKRAEQLQHDLKKYTVVAKDVGKNRVRRGATILKRAKEDS